VQKFLRACAKAAKAARSVPLDARLAKLSDVFELAGIGCGVGAVWWWHAILGLLSLGCALFYLGWVTHVPTR